MAGNTSLVGVKVTQVQQFVNVVPLIKILL